MLSIEEINKIIDEEIKYAKEVNPIMALGMEQIRMKLISYIKFKEEDIHEL